MSDLDLTEAVEAALYEYSRFGATFVDAITAAASLIEAQVRERVAREIEAQVVRDDFGRVNTFGMGEQHAARIARGGAS